jgi:hypothetical protein
MVAATRADDQKALFGGDDFHDDHSELIVGE